MMSIPPSDPHRKTLTEWFEALSQDYEHLSAEERAGLQAWLSSFPFDMLPNGSHHRPRASEEAGDPQPNRNATSTEMAAQREPTADEGEDGPFFLPRENPNPVLRLSPDGQIRYANPAAQELLRFWNCQESGEAADFWHATANMASHRGVCFSVDLVCQGRIYTFDVVPIASGFVNVYGQDVTHVRQAEAALRQSQQQLEDLLASLHDGFFELDREWRFTFINERAAANNNHTSEELLGGNIWEKLPFIAGTEYETVYRRVMSTRQAEQREIQSPLHPVLFSLSVSPSAQGISVYSQDVTDRARLEAETRQQAALSEIQRRLIEQREQERVQIARDLHDGPVQELTGAALGLQGLVLDFPDGDPARQLAAIRDSLQKQIAELRAYAQELRPPALPKFGLEKAIQSHLETFQAKHPMLHIDFQARQNGELLPEPVRLAFYRIYQQALNNIVKHAQATRVAIRLEKKTDHIELEVIDNGKGFDPPADWLALARGGHLGLVGMRERAEAVGARLEVLSRPGDGTTIRVSGNDLQGPMQAEAPERNT